MFASYINFLITQKRAPNTVEATLNDLIKLSNLVPGNLIFRLTQNQLFPIIKPLDLSPSSIERLGASLRGLMRFIADEYGAYVPRIEWWRISKKSRIMQQQILLQPDFEQLLFELRGMGSLGNLGFTGSLIGYYFGLRGSEICALSLGDVWFENTVTVLIWDSKRNASRWVQRVDIPQDVLTFLQNFKTMRKRETGDDATAKLLGDTDHRNLKRQTFGRIIEKALNLCELSIDSGGKKSLLHLFRHACANRWLALGEQIPEISHRLGHKSVDTTIRTYLHSFHFLQAEQLDKYQSTLSKLT